MGDEERRPAEIGRPGIGGDPQPIPADRIAPGDRDPDGLGRGRRDVEGDARGEGAAAEEEKIRGLAHDPEACRLSMKSTFSDQTLRTIPMSWSSSNIRTPIS